MLRISNEHTFLIGKIAKLTEFGVRLEAEYCNLFGFGNVRKAELLLAYMHHEKYEVSLIFIDEPPVKNLDQTWFCLKEIGKGCFGDWHWFTLDQLIICE